MNDKQFEVISRYNDPVCILRYNRVIVLILLLSSVLSTEVAEQWCNAAIRTGIVSRSGSITASHIVIKGESVAQATFLKCSLHPGKVIVSSSDSSIIDIPPFCYSQSPLFLVPPALSPLIATTIELVAYSIETRGPPQPPLTFAIPTLRAPPAA